MDTEALAKFKTIFSKFATKGKEQVVLRKGGVLEVSGRGSDATIRVSLPRNVVFEVERVGDKIEIWIHEQVEIKEFKLYVRRGEVKLAPNGWVVGTHYGNTVSLGIS